MVVDVGGIVQGGIGGGVIAAVMAGWLIPRWTYRQMRTDLDRWRQAYELAEERNRLQTRQIDRLLHIPDATSAALLSIDERLTKQEAGPV